MLLQPTSTVCVPNAGVGARLACGSADLLVFLPSASLLFHPFRFLVGRTYIGGGTGCADGCGGAASAGST
jgi:hypothetical protein